MMSTEPAPRKRRTSSRLIAIGGQSSPLSSSPASSPVGAIKKTRGRPSLDSTSTNSSASSNISDTFDVDKSVTLRPESPTTPNCQTPPPHGRFEAPEVRIIAQLPDHLPHSEPKLRGKRAQDAGSPPHSPESEATPLRVPRKRPRSQKCLSTDQETDHGTHLNPGNNATRQRASSAPTLSSRHEETLDLERWRELPGRFDSLSSDNDIDDCSNDRQTLPSRHSDGRERDNGNGEFSSPPAREEDSAVDAESLCSDVSPEENPIVYDEQIRRLKTSWNPLKWLYHLMQSTLVVPDSEPLPAAFTPFTCEDGDGKVRKFNGRRHINDKIRTRITQDQGRPKNPGYVYVLETKDYGPNFLKIGQTKHIPDKRISKLRRECGLRLQEIADKVQNPFYYFELVEQLVHDELDDDRLRLKCDRPKCPKEHIEWFKIHQWKALRAVDKWRKWLAESHLMNVDD